MTKTNRALLTVAAASLPVQEIAFAIPHRLEFPFCVAVACALVYLWAWVRSSNQGQILASEKVSENDDETLLRVIGPVKYISGVAAELAAQGAFTVEDLKAVASEKGIELAPLQYANILRDFRKVGEIVSPNPASKGRKIGIFAN